MLAGDLVASTMGFWTELFLQVTLICKWVSRQVDLSPHLAQVSFCFLERVFCDSRWSYSWPCHSGQLLEMVPETGKEGYSQEVGLV